MINLVTFFKLNYFRPKINFHIDETLILELFEMKMMNSEYIHRLQMHPWLFRVSLILKKVEIKEKNNKTKK